MRKTLIQINSLDNYDSTGADLKNKIGYDSIFIVLPPGPACDALHAMPGIILMGIVKKVGFNTVKQKRYLEGS